ncbi:hypothetical protein BH10PLA2_BH10PLA2_30240 [soil metagenome]
MNPIEIAARFAAYNWFQSQPQNKTLSTTEAHIYAERHFSSFLDEGLANRNFGKLLLDVIAARGHSTVEDTNAWDDAEFHASELCSVS